MTIDRFGGIDPKWIAAGAGVVAVGLVAIGVMTVGLNMRPTTALLLTGAWGGRMGMFIHRRANGRSNFGGGRASSGGIRIVVGLVVGGLILSRVFFGGANSTGNDTVPYNPDTYGVSPAQPAPGEAPNTGFGPRGEISNDAADGFCVHDVQPPDPDC